MSILDTITEPDNDWACRLNSDDVSAELFWYQDTSSMVIIDWGVKGQQREGRSRRTLQALNEHVNTIEVCGSHPPDDPDNPTAFLFWQQMLNEGLIDRLEDMNGIEYKATRV